MRWSFSSHGIVAHTIISVHVKKNGDLRNTAIPLDLSNREDRRTTARTRQTVRASRVSSLGRAPALFLAAVEVSESSCLYFQRDGEPRRLAAWLLAPMLSPIPTPSPSPIPHAITRSMMLSSQGNDCSLGTTHEPEPA